MACPFCSRSAVYAQGYSAQERTIGETETFFILPTLGCLVVNYLLIVPKKHLSCFGQLSAEQFLELAYIEKKIRDINEREFGSPTILFEHGTSIIGTLFGNSIEHAHLHILPYKNDFLTEIAYRGFKLKTINSITHLPEVVKQAQTYLYYSPPSRDSFVVLDEEVPSQFFRTILSKSIGLADEWNWRNHIHEINIEKTMLFYKEGLSFAAR